MITDTKAAAPRPSTDSDKHVRIGCVYWHYKGDRYVVEDVAMESTNGRPRERVVIYRGSEGLNVRTEKEFLEWVPEAARQRFTRDAPEGSP